MITAKQSFIDFCWKIEFDAKIGGWVGHIFSTHMTLSVGRIDMWLTPYEKHFVKSYKKYTFSEVFSFLKKFIYKERSVE